MTGLSTALIRPKMTATISSVHTFAAVSCPVSTIPGTTHAAMPSATADTRIRSRIFMALFLQHGGVTPGLSFVSLAFVLVWSDLGSRLAGGARLAMPDWLSGVVPDWLAEVMRPKKASIPWGTMARAVLAVWAPLAVGFATGQRELGLLPALGGLLSVQIDPGGPYWARIEVIGTAAILGGAPGLLIGTLIHG